MEIFKVFGSILVDSAEAEKSISKTGDKADTLADKLGKGITSAAKWGAAFTASAVAVGTAVVKAASEFSESMDTIDKGATRMSLSAEQYQELAFAADQCGIEMSTMEAAAKKLEGTDMNLDEALEQLMSIGDETERAQKASEMFGEAVAYKMAPLLQEGAEGFAEMKQEANDLGLVVSGDTVKAGAEIGDSISKIKQSFSSLKNSIMADLLPYAQKILDWVVQNMPMIQQTVKRVIDAIMPIVEPLLNMVMEFLPKFIEAFGAVIDFIMPPLEWLLNALATISSTVFSLIGSGISWLGNVLGIGGSDGSHAAGLSYVPYDGYTATLHKGETVLNANNTSELIDLINNGAGGNNEPITITVQSVLDGKVIGESTYNYINQKVRARG